MMFMVREMYRHPQLAQWKVVFVTDRTQLEQQLAETGQSIGFSVKLAESIAALKNLLRSDSSDLVMAMIHKFQERDLSQTFPELNPSPHILVMTDEAHRSQYARLAANLDKAIPNASRIGYTGTPIDKTERVFGDYIDKYTMRQSIEDGVTLEIVYEGRTHNAKVPDQPGMDTAFADVFSDYNLQERLQILGYGSRDAYLEARETIAAKARDMVQHYLTHVFPNGFKAQVVATSREAAVRYKEAIDAALAEARTALQTLPRSGGESGGRTLGPHSPSSPPSSGNTCKPSKPMSSSPAATTTCPTSNHSPAPPNTKPPSKASNSPLAVKIMASPARSVWSSSTICSSPASMPPSSRSSTLTKSSPPTISSRPSPALTGLGGQRKGLCGRLRRRGPPPEKSHRQL